MKAIILAAGRGTRLQPLTDEIPKCLVKYRGRPIVEYTLDAFRENGISDVTIVGGYRYDALRTYDTNLIVNEDFASTNMVYSLFCAESELDDDVIVSYGDIIFTPEVLRTLLADEHQFSVVVDTDWRRQWEARMDNPLLDAETLRCKEDGTIRELGKKPESYDDIEGQYLGLFRIRQEALERVKAFYHGLDRDRTYDGKDFRNMYMTSFIQLVIDELLPVYRVPISGGWLEVDTPDDLRFELEI